MGLVKQYQTQFLVFFFKEKKLLLLFEYEIKKYKYIYQNEAQIHANLKIGRLELTKFDMKHKQSYKYIVEHSHRQNIKIQNENIKRPI